MKIEYRSFSCSFKYLQNEITVGMNINLHCEQLSLQSTFYLIFNI